MFHTLYLVLSARQHATSTNLNRGLLLSSAYASKCHAIPAQHPERKQRGFSLPGMTAKLAAVTIENEACAFKLECCPNVPTRKIARSVHEAARDKARAIAKTEAYDASCRERKKVEMLFAHLK